MPKKNGRPGRNPSMQEMQLKGMLQALNVTTEQLEKTNRVLSTEASAVLEALWNGHQALVSQVGELQSKLEVLCARFPEEEAEELGMVIEEELPDEPGVIPAEMEPGAATV